MPELTVRAVVFDMDGVLIDSGDVYGRHWAAWAAAHALDPAEVQRVHPGRPPADTIRLVAPGLDAVVEAARYDATLAADDALDTVTAMPGAARLLSTLPSSRWTIATSARKDLARSWLQHVGLPVPARFVAVDDVQSGKPAPDPYLKAAALLGVDPAHCLVIEDAPAGIQAAKAAGATVLALRTTHADVDLVEADGVTQDLAAVSVDVRESGLRIRW